MIEATKELWQEQHNKGQGVVCEEADDDDDGRCPASVYQA